MPEILAHSHVASNVPRGLSPERGAGFQTVCASRALLGTADLRALEDAVSFYEVTPERRAAGDYPVRELCFTFPSGRVAVSRIINWGTSAGGRGGNSLARSLVVDPEDFRRAGADALSLLDAAWPAEAPQPLEPGITEPVTVRYERTEPDPAPLAALPADLLAALFEASVDRRPRPSLLFAPEGAARALLQALVLSLPVTERLGCAFSTHFYRACDPQRALFRWVTVRSWTEGPQGRSEYRVFDLDARKAPEDLRPGPYARWAAAAVQGGRGEDLRRLNDGVEALREGREASFSGVEEAAAATQLLGAAAAPALRGRPDQLLALLADSAPAELADAVLRLGGPADVLGPVDGEAARAEAERALGALRSRATPARWSEWQRQWQADPLVARQAHPRWAFWKR